MNINGKSTKLAIVTAAIYLSCMCYSITHSLITTNRNPISNKDTENNIEITEKESTDIAKAAEAAPIYLLADTEGKIGIYKNDDQNPVYILDVLVSTLPKSDRAMLKEGITVSSFEELVMLVQDYTS